MFRGGEGVKNVLEIAVILKESPHNQVKFIVGILAQKLLVGLYVMLSCTGIFVGVDVMAGNEIWRVRLPHRIEASAAVASDMICIGCYDGCLYALAVESGRQMWTFKTGDIIKCQPLISG